MARKLEVGPLIAIAGALLLLVSLFLDWWEESINAWKAYEVLDLVFAALAIAVIVAALRRLGARIPGVRGDWIFPAGVLALILALAQLLNHPPVAIERDAEAGLYLALGGAALMALGAVLSVARISVAVDVGSRGAPGHVEPPHAGNPVAAADRPSATPDAPTEVNPGPELG